MSKKIPFDLKAPVPLNTIQDFASIYEEATGVKPIYLFSKESKIEEERPADLSSSLAIASLKIGKQ